MILWLINIVPVWSTISLLTLAIFFVLVGPKLYPLGIYAILTKYLGILVAGLCIFMYGSQVTTGAYKEAMSELQQQVKLLEVKSEEASQAVETKLVYKIKVVKEKGDTVVEYIDREVVRYDNSCDIPKEFIEAHNRAAKP